MPEETNNQNADAGNNGDVEGTETQPVSETPSTPATSGGASPPGNTRTSATSVALTATFNFTESRKYNFDVTGAASIEATLKSVPPPSGLVEFLQKSLKPNT